MKMPRIGVANADPSRKDSLLGCYGRAGRKAGILALALLAGACGRGIPLTPQEKAQDTAARNEETAALPHIISAIRGAGFASLDNDYLSVFFDDPNVESAPSSTIDLTLKVDNCILPNVTASVTYGSGRPAFSGLRVNRFTYFPDSNNSNGPGVVFDTSTELHRELGSNVCLTLIKNGGAQSASGN